MVKSSDLTKNELIHILATSKNSKEKNRAFKLLKKFEPNPKKHLDSTFKYGCAQQKTYKIVQSYVCWRCDKAKQAVVKCFWKTSEGVKIICNTCYLNMTQYLDIARAKKETPGLTKNIRPYDGVIT